MHPDPLSTDVYGSYLIQYVEGFFQYLCIRIRYPLMYMVPTLLQCSKRFFQICMKQKLLPADVYGTYPNVTFRKVLPLFLHLDSIPTVRDTPKGSPKIMYPDPLSSNVYGTYSNTMFLKVTHLCIRIRYTYLITFQKVLPMFTYPDLLIVDAYGTYCSIK
jgi:hypothetical protein